MACNERLRWPRKGFAHCGRIASYSICVEGPTFCTMRFVRHLRAYLGREMNFGGECRGFFCNNN